MVFVRCPQFLQGFFAPARQRLSKPQFRHCWALLVALAVGLRKAKLVHLARLVEGHRTAHGAFLASGDGVAELLQQQLERLLRRMKPKRGEVLYLIIDDTRIAKRGRRMAGVSKIYDHATQRFVHGHIVVTAALQFRGVTLPWRFDLWSPKRQAGRSYRKLTAIAADLVRTVAVPAGLKVRVLFDAYYLCPAVTRACETRGFTWFSVASKNRTFTTDRQRRRIGQLAPGLLKHEGRGVRMRRARGSARLRIASRDGRLAKIGDVRMVLSKRPRARWKTCVAFVTNEQTLDARAIVAIYERRWAIEVLIKELRELGLGDYQVLRREAIENHLALCGLAHLMLTHHSLDAVGAEATKANETLTLPPLSTRRERFRAAARREQLDQIIGRTRHAKFRRKLRKIFNQNAVAA